MLFSRVYNWIKYKTLPPSVLFSNRLFVERDSKHRRVTSNLGLTFRNSKWSSYARTNINLVSRSGYTALMARLFIALMFIAVILSFSVCYDKNLLPTSVFTLVWFLFDADLYAKALFSSSLLCTFQIILTGVQSRLFSTVSDTTYVPNPFDYNKTKTHFPKHLHKPILYGWLTRNFSDVDVSEMFGSQNNKVQILNTFNLLGSLYSSVRLIRRSDDSNLRISDILEKLENQNLTQLKTYLNLGLNRTHIKSSLKPYLLDYILYNTHQESRSSYFDECSTWVLADLQTEFSCYNNSINGSSGLFYAPELSHSKLNLINTRMPELSSIRTSVENQLSVIRWQRWLYKYNILHRSVLRNTQYLTSTKKLLNSGFFSSSLTTRNIWAASVFSGQGSVDDSTLGLNSVYSTLYGNYTGLNKTAINSMRSGQFFYNHPMANSLSYYELSYHWFIQRFYQFNTLHSNSVASTPSLSTQALNNSAENAKLLEQMSVLFDLDVSSAMTSKATTYKQPLTVTNTADNAYLNYYDYTLFTKSRNEQMINMAKSRVGRGVPFYLPVVVQNNDLPSYK